MKMMSSTSSTSMSGVTLISELRPSPERVDPIAMGQRPSFFFLPSDSGCCSGGTGTSKAFAIIGVMIMKMMSSTSITSISGVTLMSALTADAARALVTDRATGLLRLLRLEFLGEDRAAELGADALDQV